MEDKGRAAQSSCCRFTFLAHRQQTPPRARTSYPGPSRARTSRPIEEAIATLAGRRAPLSGLPTDSRRSLVSMGEKSESPCPSMLMLLSQNTRFIPCSYDLAEAQRELGTLDLPVPRFSRLQRFLRKADAAARPRRSGIPSAAVDTYADRQGFGKAAGEDVARKP